MIQLDSTLSQKEQLKKLFKDSGWILTLGQILNTNLAAAYRGRMSDLRADGHDIPDPIINYKERSKTLYVFYENGLKRDEPINAGRACPESLEDGSTCGSKSILRGKCSRYGEHMNRKGLTKKFKNLSGELVDLFGGG